MRCDADDAMVWYGTITKMSDIPLRRQDGFRSDQQYYDEISVKVNLRNLDK